MAQLRDKALPPLPDPRKVGINFAIAGLLLFSVLAVDSMMGRSHVTFIEGVSLLLALAITNLTYSLLLVSAVFSVNPLEVSPKLRWTIAAILPIVAAIPRAVTIDWIMRAQSDEFFIFTTFISGSIAGVFILFASITSARILERARAEQARWWLEANRSQQISEELQAEEIRVRRMVADQLHGRLQHELVTVSAGMDALASQMETAAGAHEEQVEQLRNLANQLDEVRDREVRGISHTVYPAGIELSATGAIKAMLHRLPPQIASTFQTGPGFGKLTAEGGVQLSMADRLITVFTVEEAITNALKHGRATSISVFLDVQEDVTAPAKYVLAVRVDDDGVGVGTVPSNQITAWHDAEKASEFRRLNQAPENSRFTGNGLLRQAERLARRGGSLALNQNPAGGTRLEFALPFQMIS